MTFAAKTRVPVERTRAEIEHTLTRFHASKFAYFTEVGCAIVVFEAHLRRLRFDLPLPTGDTERDRQQCRQKWRALLLAIKDVIRKCRISYRNFRRSLSRAHRHARRHDRYSAYAARDRSRLQGRADAAAAASAVEEIIERWRANARRFFLENSNDRTTHRRHRRHLRAQ